LEPPQVPSFETRAATGDVAGTLCAAESEKKPKTVTAHMLGEYIVSWL